MFAADIELDTQTHVTHYNDIKQIQALSAEAMPHGNKVVHRVALGPRASDPPRSVADVEANLGVPEGRNTITWSPQNGLGM